MLNTILTFETIEDATTIVRKHYKENTEIAQLINERVPGFINIFDSIVDIISQENPEVIMTPQIEYTMLYFAELCPLFLVIASHLDWNEFLSAYIFVITVYQDYLEKHNYEKADTILTQLVPIYRMAEFGAGYEELIRASNMLVAEMKLWRDIAPPSLKLSQAYLESLGYYKSKTDE